MLFGMPSCSLTAVSVWVWTTVEKEVEDVEDAAGGSAADAAGVRWSDGEVETYAPRWLGRSFSGCHLVDWFFDVVCTVLDLLHGLSLANRTRSTPTSSIVARSAESSQLPLHVYQTFERRSRSACARCGTVRLGHPRLVEVEVDPVEPVHQALAEMAENELEIGQLVEGAGVDDPHGVCTAVSSPKPSPGPGIAQPYPRYGP